MFQGISFLSPLSHSLLLPYCLRFRPDYMSVLSSLRPSTIFDRFRFSKKGDLEDLSSVETVVELIGGFWVKLTTVSLKILLYKHKKYGDLNTIKQCYHHPWIMSTLFLILMVCKKYHYILPCQGNFLINYQCLFVKVMFHKRLLVIFIYRYVSIHVSTSIDIISVIGFGLV